MTELTTNTAKGREAIAAKVTELAERLGASVTREDRDREIHLKIATPGGAYLPLRINGDCKRIHGRPNVFIATWNTEADSLFAFSDRMCEPNRFHFAKAGYTVYNDVDELLDLLEIEIGNLVTGRGYSIDRAKAKAGERVERHNRVRDYYKPLVDAGKGTVFPSGAVDRTPEQLRAEYDRIPSLIAGLESFIAAGCPMHLASGHPSR